MALRGRVTNEQGEEFVYQVEQYRYHSSDRIYKSRSASDPRLDKSDLEWARISVKRADGEGNEIFTTLYGPYLRTAVIEDQLSVAMSDDGYREAIG